MTFTTKPALVTIDCSDDALELRIEVDDAGTARMTRLAAAAPPRQGEPDPPLDLAGVPDDEDLGVGLPLVDVLVAGEGRHWSGGRYCESATAARMRYLGHAERTLPAGPSAPGWRELRIDLADPATGLQAQACYQVLAGQGALRSWTRLVNEGERNVTINAVTSFLCGLPCGRATSAGGLADPADLDIRWAENQACSEGRWQRRAVRDALPDLNTSAQGGDPHAAFGMTSTGTWSSGTYLPMGALEDRRAGHTWVWQIEHNGAWHWQVGEFSRRARHDDAAAGAPAGHVPPSDPGSGVYFAVLGPTDLEHQWRVTLPPGGTFTTVPAAVAVSGRGFEDALARLTGYRRAVRRPHEDHRRLPVIFNDFMNALMGEPTTEKLLPLIAAAARAGAEYFCIDCGWYAEIDEFWWDTVGAWRPSATRFPGGLTEVLNQIKAAGMVPGLWLEPEVVGMRSPVAGQLPDEAFFTRGGERVAEHGRYHLDLRHPAAVKHLDEVVDYLVRDLGVGYLKLDYNINAGPGTDAGGVTAGAGLLGHNRAYLDWLDGVLDRYPRLTIENCSSGGMRMDYAMLSRLQLQSTSDQQDHLLYAAIAAAAPAALAPEQAAIWAYPQPEFGDDEITFALCNALLGRVHLSGHLDRMTGPQQRLVADAIAAYKQIRSDLALSVPFWPLGLPGWTDSSLALGMHAPTADYLLVWHRRTARDPADPRPRGGAGSASQRSGAEPPEITLPLRHLLGRPAAAEVMYPSRGPTEAGWDASSGTLTVALPGIPSACLIRVRPGRALGSSRTGV